MYQHVLLIHSDYSKGTRIALHRCYESVSSIKDFLSLSSKVKEKFKHLTFSFHHLQTMERSTNSIAEYDKFFSDIELYSDLQSFIRQIEEDTTTKPIDIAKILLSKYHYSHLELQKMIYFVYCEYIKIYGEYMFKDDFQAWTYGPVLPDVYDLFCKYGRNKMKHYSSEKSNLKIYSRTMKIDKYERIRRAIDSTIKKYGDMSVGDLVDKSHVKGGPWDQIYKEGQGQYEIIPKNLIKEYVRTS